MESSKTHYEDMAFVKFIATMSQQGEFHYVENLEHNLAALGENLADIESIKVQKDLEGNIGHWYLFTTKHCYHVVLCDIVWSPRSPEDITVL